MLARMRYIFHSGIRALHHLASGILIAAWLSILLEVTLRYLFNRPQVWVVEAVSYSILWVTLLATAWVLKEDKHVKMEWTLSKLGPRNQALLKFITSIVCAITFLAITWYSGQLTWHHYVNRVYVMSELEPLQAPLLAIIPIAFLLLAMQLVVQAHDNLTKWRALREGLGPVAIEKPEGVSDY